MSKWWRIDTDRGWRGQSETVGVVLLAAIALVLVAAIGLFLLSDTGGDDQNELLLADLDSELTASNVTISHAAGDTLDPTELNVLIEDNSRQIPFDEFSGTDEEFTAGETATFQLDDPSEFWIGEFRVIVVHEPTNTILHDEAKSVEFSDEGLQLEVEGRNAGLSSNSVSVWGKPSPALDLVNPDEVKWDFKVTAAFGSEEQVITDSLGDAYDLTVPSTPSGDVFESPAVSNGDDRGTLESKQVTGNETVTIKAEYTSDNVPDGISDRFVTSEVNVTVDEPSQAFNIDGDIDPNVTNNNVQVDYTITSDADLTLGQDISFTVTPKDSNGNVISPPGDTTGTSLSGVSASDTDVDLSPGASTSNSFNYTVPAGSTSEVEVEIAPQDGSPYQDTETFTPATFKVDSVNTDLDFDNSELTVEYAILNEGSFTGTKDIEFNATAFDTGGNPINSVDYAGTEFTDTDASVQIDSGETLDKSDSQISPFVFPLPPNTDEIKLNVSTPDDTVSRTLAAAIDPTNFTVTNVDLKDIVYNPSTDVDEVEVEYTVENKGGLGDTQNLSLRAFDDTGAGFPASPDSTTEDSNVNLAPGDTYTNTATFHSVSQNADEVKVEVVPELGLKAQDSIVNIDPPEHNVTSISATTEFNTTTGEDEIVVDYTVENTGDLTYNTEQTVNIAFAPSSGSTITQGEGVKVPAGQSRSLTHRSGSVRTTLAGPETYDITAQADASGETTVLVVDEANYSVSIDDSSFDGASEELVVNYTVTNNGDLTDSIDTELYTLDSSDNRIDASPLDSSSTTNLQSGDSTSGTLTHSVRESDIISNAVSFEVAVVPTTYPAESGGDTAQGSIGVAPPNFVIDTFTVTPDFANEEVTVDYTVRNDGDLTATRDIGLISEVGGTQEDNANRSAVQLAPGDSTSKTETLSVPEPATSSQVTVTLDTEDNNQTYTQSVDPALFDISITSASISNGVVSVDYQVENTGSFTDTQDITLDVDGSTEDTNGSVNLGPGDTDTGTLTSGTLSAPGDGQFDITVAGSGNSNDATTTLSVTPATFTVSLVDDKATYDPASETATVDYTVQNTGDFPATRDVVATALTDGNSDTNADLQLDAGESTGTLSLTVDIDSAGQQDIEVTAGDNAPTDSINPDPALFDISITDASISNGVVSVDYTVENTGEFADTQDILLDIEGSQEDTDGGVNLAPGDSPTSGTLTSSTLSPPGDGQFDITVSGSGNSNDATTTLSVTPPQITVDVTNLRVTGSEKLAFDYTVSNANSADFTAERTLSASASGPSSPSVSLGVSNPVSIAPGDSVSSTGVTTDNALSAGGDHTVTVSYGSDSDSETLGVAGPSFDVSIDNAPSEATTGGSISVDATVTNTGDIGGTKSVDLTVSAGSIGSDSGSVTLDGGANTQVTRSVNVPVGTTPGTYDATVSSPDSSDTRQVDIIGPSYTVSVNAPNSVVRGEDVPLDVTISNANSAGDGEPQLDVSFLGNTQSRNSLGVLAAGNSLTESFTFSTSKNDGGNEVVTATETTTGTDGTATVTIEEPTIDLTVSVTGGDVSGTQQATDTVDVFVDGGVLSNSVASAMNLATDGGASVAEGLSADTGDEASAGSTGDGASAGPTEVGTNAAPGDFVVYTLRGAGGAGGDDDFPQLGTGAGGGDGGYVQVLIDTRSGSVSTQAGNGGNNNNGGGGWDNGNNGDGSSLNYGAGGGGGSSAVSVGGSLQAEAAGGGGGSSVAGQADFYVACLITDSNDGGNGGGDNAPGGSGGDAPNSGAGQCDSTESGGNGGTWTGGSEVVDVFGTNNGGGANGGSPANDGSDGSVSSSVASVNSISVSPNSQTMLPGQSVDFSVDSVTIQGSNTINSISDSEVSWSSSGGTVDGTGTFSASSPGNYDVTATYSNGGSTASTTVTVNVQQPADIQLSGINADNEVAVNNQLSVDYTLQNTGDVSGNADVTLEISGYGQVDSDNGVSVSGGGSFQGGTLTWTVPESAT